MAHFEVHAMTQCGEDLGVMVFENSEMAVYENEKVAQRIADGMNEMRKIRGCGMARHDYVVVRKEV